MQKPCDFLLSQFRPPNVPASNQTLLARYNYGSCSHRFVRCGYSHAVKVKAIPQQAEVAQGAPGGLRPRIFLTFGTTRVVGRQSYAPAAFTPGEIPGIHFRPQGTWFRREPPPPGIDPGTSRLVAQCLNHYATPGPQSRS